MDDRRHLVICGPVARQPRHVLSRRETCLACGTPVWASARLLARLEREHEAVACICADCVTPAGLAGAELHPETVAEVGDWLRRRN